MQNRLGLYENWVKGFKTTIKSEPSDFQSVTADSNRVELSFILTARDKTSSGTTTQRWRSNAVVIKEGGQWRIADLENKKL